MQTEIPTKEAGSSLRYLKGIGPKRATLLEKQGVKSVYDLLFYFPRRYEDRSKFFKIAHARPGQSVTVRATILRIQFKPIRRLKLLEILVGDDSGTLHAVWFNQPYLKNQFQTGQEIILYGRIDFYQNRLQINTPEYEIIEPEEKSVHTGRITPVYPLTEGLFQRSLRALMKDAVEQQLEKTVTEYLPESFRQKKNLMGLRSAVSQMHFPSSFEAQEMARRRIVYDELFLFEIILLRKMRAIKNKYRSFDFKNGGTLSAEFIRSLAFQLTSSQTKALEDIVRDFEAPYPASRLLHGDVGSGKTVVAAFALYYAAKNNHQAALLVPTEILAEQHLRTLKQLLAPFNIEPELLTSSTQKGKREKMLYRLRSGSVRVLIGTHAIFQEDVRFKNLSLVIIDEQHKFGVHQRNQLLQGSPRPHQLVMTATPIPRTLALTAFGDLEVSSMHELPAGRQPIKTYWIERRKQNKVLAHILDKVKTGEQAYIIFPLIDETERSDLLAAEREYEKLRTSVFSDVSVGLVHGRIPALERDKIMTAFTRGEVQILVSTSVIEVGVDNPNATFMIIENAERFGLSQLHQMRGRIGRGTKPSQCFLFGEPKSTEGKQRLKIMTETQDGFVIAEEDLKLRGPGDFLGTRQSGIPLFRYADAVNDYGLLKDAHQTASNLIESGQWDESPQWEAARQFIDRYEVRH
ncbi:ATP-dependent DNA helicase RecG [Omnitrophica bacterium]|nr:ATP-dependent DNA helicase RecG [Candidatus Omnitrophota bacterium]